MLSIHLKSFLKKRSKRDANLFILESKVWIYLWWQDNERKTFGKQDVFLQDSSKVCEKFELQNIEINLPD